MVSRPLLILLELLLLLLPLAASLATYISEAKHLSSDHPLVTCTSVPYPFGIAGKAMKGFEVSCNGTSPILQLMGGNFSYQIEDISLLQGSLSIYSGAIFQYCDTYLTAGSGWINLKGTPYTISDTHNMLTMVGRNQVAVLSSDEVTITQGYFLNNSSLARGGCVTFCPSNDTIISGSCSGLGCCQASIPRGLKSFNILSGNISDLQNITQTNITRCSQAFLVKQSSFTFSREKLLEGVYDDQFSQDGYLTTLDWAIGNETCDAAMRKMEAFACKGNSYCYNSTNGLGYRCNCSQGYHGNPYIGCKDINECEDPELNPCVGLCINEPGNVSCTCPTGQHGDGRKQGSGCMEKNFVNATVIPKKEKDKAFPLEVALGVGLSLLFIVFGSLWLYWLSNKRN